MKVLVVNAGSSSLKYQIIDMDNEAMLCKGLVERIGSEGSNLAHQTEGKEKLVVKKEIKNHTDALRAVIDALTDKEYGVINDVSEINAVGHRVLHSGEDFKDSVVIDDEVIRICKKNSVLGPLHMPANISCIESCKEVMPNTPMVAVFDTAFHQTMPPKAYMYAIPLNYYKDYKIRRYGFHGTSHKFVSTEVAKYLGKTPEELKTIVCHLGNGASVSAVQYGKCIDTSMGLTPLEGLIMGTRCGDLDPAVVDYIMGKTNMSAYEIDQMMNKDSGVYALSGNLSSDFRDLWKAREEGNKNAELALDAWAYRVAKYIGAYVAAMNGVDVICFTAGVGENDTKSRALIYQYLGYLGIEIDEEKNAKTRGEIAEISKPESKVKVFVFPTNEELAIAQETLALVQCPVKYKHTKKKAE